MAGAAGPAQSHGVSRVKPSASCWRLIKVARFRGRDFQCPALLGEPDLRRSWSPGTRHLRSTTSPWTGGTATRPRAVKETAKDIANFPRYNAGLLIEGASPGSVRVVLKAPTPPTTEDLPPSTSVSSVDSEALRRIARVMTLASEADENTSDDEPLDAAIQQLPIKAQTKLKSAADQAIKTNWEIDGSIRQRHHGRDRVELSPRGASRLR